MNTLVRIVFSCIVSVAFLAGSLSSMACSKPPGYGYIVHSILNDTSTYPLPVITSQVGQTLTGEWLSNDFGALGYQYSWEGVTDSSGNISRLGYATPAQWEINWVTGPCSPSDPYYHGVGNYEAIDFQPSSSLQYLTCYRASVNFSSSPSTLHGTGREQNVTVTGSMYGRTPVSWKAYNASGTEVSSGGLGNVTQNSCVCYWSCNYFVYGQVTLTTYLLDNHGQGIGSFHSSYTYQ